MRDVDRRDYDHESADDLPKVGEVAEIHGFQLEPGGRLRSIAPTCVDPVLELTFVLRAVEMAFALCDKSVAVDLPKFVAANSDSITGATRACVRASQCPMKSRSVAATLKSVE